MDNVVRSGYYADIATLPKNLPTLADGSYQPVGANVPLDFRYVDHTILYTGADAVTGFVEFNQAQTTFPWSAMGRGGSNLLLDSLLRLGRLGCSRARNVPPCFLGMVVLVIRRRVVRTGATEPAAP